MDDPTHAPPRVQARPRRRSAPCTGRRSRRPAACRSVQSINVHVRQGCVPPICNYPSGGDAAAMRRPLSSMPSPAKHPLTAAAPCAHTRRRASFEPPILCGCVRGLIESVYEWKICPPAVTESASGTAGTAPRSPAHLGIRRRLRLMGSRRMGPRFILSIDRSISRNRRLDFDPPTSIQA